MRKWLIAAGAFVFAAAGVLTFVLWPDPPSDEECRDLFVEAISGGEFPAECQEWFDGSIAQIEQQTDVINACQDRVVEVHARHWTPELTFTGADVGEEGGDLRVTGTAESTNQLGQTWQWSYECTVLVETDGIRVTEADTERV
jgi:hypothetical protein